MDKILEKAIDEMMLHDYGHTITHHEIAEIIGIRVFSKAYYGFVGRLRREMLRRQKMMENVKNVGYRIAEPNSYTKSSVRQFSIAGKRMKAGTDILENAPLEKMSQEAREEHRRVSERVMTLQATMTSGLVELRILRKHHPLESENRR